MAPAASRSAATCASRASGSPPLRRTWQPKPGETVLDQRGLALAPGFIDMHSHGSRGLTEDLDAATVSRQGITTILVGQDGESNFPLRDYLRAARREPAGDQPREHGRARNAARAGDGQGSLPCLDAAGTRADENAARAGTDGGGVRPVDRPRVRSGALRHHRGSHRPGQGRGRRQGLLHQPRPRRSESHVRLVRRGAAHRPRSEAAGRDHAHQDGLDLGLAPGREAHAGVLRARATGRRRSQGRRLSLHVLALHDSRDRARPRLLQSAEGRAGAGREWRRAEHPAS